jgi:hypothetical protein
MWLRDRDLLRQTMAEKGLTAAGLARVVQGSGGPSDRYIRYLLDGTHDTARPVTAAAISAALGIDPLELWTTILRRRLRGPGVTRAGTPHHRPIERGSTT